MTEEQNVCFRRKSDLADYRTIESLKPEPNTSILKLRNSVNVYIIEDDPSFTVEGFSKLGYNNVTVHREAEDVAEYKMFDIILCDIHGIANDCSSNEEGLAFAKQLNKLYPCTEIYIYTGQNVRNFGSTDGLPVIHKPKTKAELAEIFDKSIRNMIDPSYIWNKFYRFLYENKIKPKDIVLIEDRFVRAYEGKTRFDVPQIARGDINDAVSNAARFVGIAAAAFTKEICSQ